MNKNNMTIIAVIIMMCLYLARPQIFTALISDRGTEYDESYSEQSVLSKKEQMYQYLKEKFGTTFQQIKEILT